MAFDPTSPRKTAMLRTTLQAAADQSTVGDNALRAEFKSDFLDLKKDIQSSLGDALTQINTRVTDIDQAQRGLDAAGARIMETMDKQQATYMTNLQEVVANARSEFGVVRSSIDVIAADVRVMQSGFEGMAWQKGCVKSWMPWVVKCRR